MDSALDRSKKARYVTAYEQLHEMILKGDFSETGKLPTEPKLAQMLGVSRMTLRQALVLLNEDGLVKNIHGKGNFITIQQEKNKLGLEKLGNPVYKCCDLVIDSVEMNFRIEPPNQHMQEVFFRKSAAAVVVDRWYRCKDNFVAYSLTFIPIETISLFEIDLNDHNVLLKFVEDGIYELAQRASLEIKPSTTGKFISNKYVITDKKYLNLVLESLYGEEEYPLLCNKHYLVIDTSTIKMNATR